MRSFGTLAAVFCILMVSASPALATDVAERSRVALTEIRSTGISWQPLVDFKSAVLTVSGPDGAFMSRKFGRGESIQLQLVDKRANAFADGQYAWELRLAPSIEPAVKRALEDARESGDERVVAELKRQGKLPEGAVISGYFRVRSGSIVTPDKAESVATVERSVSEPDMGDAGGAAVASADKDQVILDDLIVDGSACIGQDCVNGESFGFDTIRIKENNLRIKAQDTSSTASFPSNDWQLTFNDSSNGGANKFSIDDIDGGRTPFTIEAGTPNHALYVDSSNRVGFGTSTPVVDLHVVSGNTPTLRLEQDGSSGFAAQIWDVAGNEAGFFVRDATNGSTLPLRIRPGASSSAIDIQGDNDVGMGTGSPNAALHVRRTNATASLLVEEASSTAASRQLLTLTNNGGVGFDLNNTATTENWRMVNSGATDNSTFIITNTSSAGAQFTVQEDGDVLVQGTISSGGTQLNVPDYVFEADYNLPSMAELAEYIAEYRHLPNVPSAEELKANGLNHSEFQMRLLEKVEELTLYTLAQQETIEELENARVDAEQLRVTIKDLQNRLENLESGSGAN